MLWACGGTPAGKGYVALIRGGSTGAPKVEKTRLLDEVCRGLTLHDQGLALWLEGWQAMWISDPERSLRAPASVTQISLRPSPGSFADQWPIRGVWSAEQRRFYLAAGERGVVALTLGEQGLSEVVRRETPTCFARDVAITPAGVAIADPKRGVLLWDPRTETTVGSWVDPKHAQFSGVQRLGTLDQGLWVAAGWTGLYRLGWGSESSPTDLGHTLHQRSVEPVFDFAVTQEGVVSISATRVYLNGETRHQVFPALAGHTPLRSIAPAGGARFWLAKGHEVELWESAHQSKRARLVPQNVHASLVRGSPSLTGDALSFVVRGDADLWVKAPKSLQREGVSQKLGGWPRPEPGCGAHYRFAPGSHFWIHLEASELAESSHSMTLTLGSSDPEHGSLPFAVDIDPPSLAEMLERPMPNLSLVHAYDGLHGRLRVQGKWHWIELMHRDQVHRQEARMVVRELAELIKGERRNGRFKLALSVVIGGRLFEETSPDFPSLGLAADSGVDLYFDERFSLNRFFRNTPNGRYYPLRMLVSPEGKIVYFDQHQGLANAVGEYRKRKLDASAQP